jgi:hypothetical protein
MAIDTRAKRASVAGILSFLPPGITNDGTPDQAWRQAVGFGYFGILADEPRPEIGASEVVFSGLGYQTEVTLVGSSFN